MVVDFLTPQAALVGLAGLVPLAAELLAERRAGRVRRALGLAEPGPWRRTPAVLATLLLFGLLAAAAAQPVLRTEQRIAMRTDAEAYVIVDISRSMLAADTPGAPTRLDRARALALRLRGELADVPLGVASLTDRPLPHLFPSADAGAFAAVVDRVLAIERPPPEEAGQVLSTSLGSLEALARANFYSAGSVKRLAIVLTDGESRSFVPAELDAALDAEGIRLLTVHLWGPAERVWQTDGRPESYRPDAASASVLERLAGGRAFAESEAAAVVASARSFLGTGPTAAAGRTDRTTPIGGWVALAAALPLAFLLSRGVGWRLRPAWWPTRPVAPRARTGSARSAS